MLLCLIVGDINFDYLLKAVSTSFSTVKLLFSEILDHLYYHYSKFFFR